MLNTTIIQGRLTRDPELRATNTGKSVTSFTVAWSEKYGESEQKLFLPCVAWGTQAEFVSRYFAKGQEIIVDGRLTSRKWQDKDGNNRETTELIANRIHFCGSKQSNSEKVSADVEDDFTPFDDGEDLPF